MPKITARVSLEYPFCPLSLIIDTRFLIELAPRYKFGIITANILYLATPNTFKEIKTAGIKITKVAINATHCRLITISSLFIGLLFIFIIMCKVLSGYILTLINSPTRLSKKRILRVKIETVIGQALQTALEWGEQAQTRLRSASRTRGSCRYCEPERTISIVHPLFVWSVG